jgi:hypothetical protein
MELTENNRKMQEVLDYFNEKVEDCPFTILSRNGSDIIEGYSVVLGDKTRGPRGVGIDLDIDYRKAFDEGQSHGYTERASSLINPEFLQDALARTDLTANLGIFYDPNKPHSAGESYLGSYDFTGDKITRDIMDHLFDEESFNFISGKIPKQYLQRIKNIEEGEDIKKAIEVAFDLYKWDNDM